MNHHLLKLILLKYLQKLLILLWITNILEMELSILVIICFLYMNYAGCSSVQVLQQNKLKKLFSLSLKGRAEEWYKLLQNGQSLEWEEIVPLFYSKFYPPS